jgi:uncharacterized phage protein (TIGR01671 family)
MREIKFKFYYKNKLIDELTLKEIALKDNFQWAEDVSIVQFTGLHDKNGKEIWEGDIVKDIIEDELCIIEWAKPWAQFVGTKIKSGITISSILHPKDLIYSDHFEVVGNIFEIQSY